MRLARAALCALATMATGCGHTAPEDVATETVVPVKVTPAHVGAIHGVVQAAGIVATAPGADFNVTAPASARIAAIPVAEGDRVAKGALLVRFDVPALAADVASRQAEVEQAQARVATTTAAVTRARELFERGVAARREMEEAEQALAEATAALAQAHAARGAAHTMAQRTAVHAPFAGVVAKRLHNPGDLVEPSATDTIIRLIDPKRLEVSASVLIGDISRVRVGAAAQLLYEGADPEPLTVVSRPAAIEPTTASAPVRLAFQSLTGYAAGTPVRVEIEAEVHDHALLVPQAALVREGAETTVFVAGADAKAHRRVVTIGLASGSAVEIADGLREGELIIVEGQAGLPDGASIAVPK
jgi:RND family efflux transporter MFP subunit